MRGTEATLARWSSQGTRYGLKQTLRDLEGEPKFAAVFFLDRRYNNKKQVLYEQKEPTSGRSLVQSLSLQWRRLSQVFQWNLPHLLVQDIIIYGSSIPLSRLKSSWWCASQNTRIKLQKNASFPLSYFKKGKCILGGSERKSTNAIGGQSFFDYRMRLGKMTLGLDWKNHEKSNFTWRQH